MFAVFLKVLVLVENSFRDDVIEMVAFDRRERSLVWTLSNPRDFERLFVVLVLQIELGVDARDLAVVFVFVYFHYFHVTPVLRSKFQNS